jgi:hypothetical protein
MEAVCFSETLVNFSRNTRRQIPQYSTLDEYELHERIKVHDRALGLLA